MIEDTEIARIIISDAEMQAVVDSCIMCSSLTDCF